MKIDRSFLLAAAIILATAGTSSAQVVIQSTSGNAPQSSQSETEMSDDDIIRMVFDPVTDQLKLTPAQRYRIVTIASSTISSAQALFTQFDEVDLQMSVAAFSGNLDEAKLKELSTRQAALMSDISVTFARAKTHFYNVLTPEQRAIVLAQYRTSDQNLGALSNVGP